MNFLLNEKPKQNDLEKKSDIEYEIYDDEVYNYTLDTLSKFDESKILDKDNIKMLLGIDIDKQGIVYYNTKTHDRGARARYLELTGEYLSKEYKPEIIQNNDIYYIVSQELN